MRIILIPLLSDNYGYLLVCEETSEAAIVDPSEAGPILDRIKSEGVKPVAVLNTHHHWDHIGGNEELLKAFPDLRIVAHRSDKGRIQGLTDLVDEGDTVRFGKVEGRVIFIPCHTSGHVAYLFGDAVFTGDMLFSSGCGRFFEGGPEEMHDAINKKLALLPDATRVFCGHEYTVSNLRFALSIEPGNRALKEKLAWAESRCAKQEPTVPSTIGNERETNPFMRVETEAIRKAISEKYPGSPLDPVTVLARVRELKDNF